MTEANPRALMDMVHHMETAAITFQSCNLGICKGHHTTRRHEPPAGEPDHPRQAQDPRAVHRVHGLHELIDTKSPYYDSVFSWLSQMVRGRQNEAECIMGYMAVPKLGSHDDYSAKEAYLESFFGVATTPTSQRSRSAAARL